MQRKCIKMHRYLTKSVYTVRKKEIDSIPLSFACKRRVDKEKDWGGGEVGNAV